MIIRQCFKASTACSKTMKGLVFKLNNVQQQ